MEFAADNEKAKQAEGEGQSQLFFGVGEYIFALNLDSLVRVVDLSSDSEKEKSGREIDLRKFFRVENEDNPISGREGFRIDLKIGNQDYGLRVDTVFGIRDFQLAIPLDFPGALRNEDNQAISGFLFDGKDMICKLDAEKLIKSSDKGLI